MQWSISANRVSNIKETSVFAASFIRYSKTMQDPTAIGEWFMKDYPGQQREEPVRAQFAYDATDGLPKVSRFIVSQKLRGC